MGAVSRILDFKPRWEVPTLVLVDLQEGGASPADSHHAAFLDALEKCRVALNFARAHRFPVAFVRHISPSRSLLAAHDYPAWLHDLRPLRTDMVFERYLPSCYASSEFAQMARRGVPLVMAGIFGETSCLATLMDGHSRNHLFTYLADASVSRGHDGISAAEVHRNVVAIAALYGEVSSTSNWMDRLAPRINAAS